MCLNEACREKRCHAELVNALCALDDPATPEASLLAHMAVRTMALPDSPALAQSFGSAAGSVCHLAVETIHWLKVDATRTKEAAGQQPSPEASVSPAAAEHLERFWQSHPKTPSPDQISDLVIATNEDEPTVRARASARARALLRARFSRGRSLAWGSPRRRFAGGSRTGRRGRGKS